MIILDLEVLSNISYGLYAVTVDDNGRPTGCIINTLIQVTSFEPIYMAISLNKDSYTSEVIERNKKYAINILSEDTPKEVIMRLGFASGRDRDKMDRIDYKLRDGLPVINENCSGFMIFELVSKTRVDTHDIIIGKLIDGCRNEFTPMTYKYYHEVIKGKAPKSAPTYLTNK